MNKKVRKAVRTFLINNDKIITIKYKTEKNKDYYDIPGGKIEPNETAIEASIREFMEETGITITTPKYIGHAIIEYPQMIFDFELFLATNYEGEPQNFDENDSLWIDIEELKNSPKKFPCIEIINHLNKDNINLKIYSDEFHNITKIDK